MDKKALINRLNRLQGQIEAIKKSVEQDERDCIKILSLTKAVQGAIKNFAEEYITQDIEYCLTKDEMNPRELEKKLKAVIESSFKL